MAKKKSIKKFKAAPKIKSSFPKFNLQETSFNELSLQHKVIAVVLITLAVCIVASLFSNNITGGVIFNNPTFDNVFYTIDNIITRVFPEFQTSRLFVYEKFVLFLLLFTLLSGAAKLLNFRGMTNVIVAGSISLISIWFIPQEVLMMIGLTYGATYASLLMLIPILTVGYLAWKIPGTRGGCFAKAIIFFILLVIFGATRDGLISVYSIGKWYNTYADTIILVLFILTIWYVIRAITINATAEDAARERWVKEKAENSIARVIVTRVQEDIAGGAEKAKRIVASGR